MKPVAIELATPEDLNYITSTWMRSYQSSAVGHALGPSAYATWRIVIGACIEHGATFVARPLDDVADTILGWACTEGGTLHYAFVRPAFRSLGIATQLLARHVLETKTHAMQGKFDALRYVSYRP